MNGRSIVRIISSERDAEIADRLRRALIERGLEARLHAASDLTESDAHLVVVCSPTTRESVPVSEAVIRFRDTHPRSQILPVLILDGDAPPEDAAIPPVLRSEPGRDGFLQPVDPPPAAASARREDIDYRAIAAAVAARVRPEATGALGRARQALRRGGEWSAAAAAALAVAAIGLGVWGYEARQGEREAERFASALLTTAAEDLPVAARRDVLVGIADQTLAALGDDSPRSLSDEELGRRARLWHVMGEAHDMSGDPERAAEAFALAYRMTEALLMRAPDDPGRMFDHAQSAFWIANSAWRRGDLRAAKPYYAEYAALADQMTAAEPGNPAYQAERAFASLNSGVVAFEEGEGRRALSLFEEAIDQFEAPVEAGAVGATELANAQAWRADALFSLGRLEDSLDARAAEAAIYERRLADRPDDARTRGALAYNQVSRAELEAASGALEPANALLEEALATLEDLAEAHPENARFRRNHAAALFLRGRTAAVGRRADPRQADFRSRARRRGGGR